MKEIVVGAIVKFIDGLYPDESGALYQVTEVNGDRCFIRSLDGTPFPPVSVAMIDELERLDKNATAQKAVAMQELRHAAAGILREIWGIN